MSLDTAPSFYTSGASNRPDPATGAALLCSSSNNQCVQSNNLTVPLPKGICDASGTYGIRAVSRCSNTAGNPTTIPGVDCSAQRVFKFSLETGSLCSDFNKTVGDIIGGLASVKTHYALDESVTLRLNVWTGSDFVLKDSITAIYIDDLKVESVKHAVNFTLIQSRAPTTLAETVVLAFNGEPYIADALIEVVPYVDISFLPNVAQDGMIKPNGRLSALAGWPEIDESDEILALAPP